jgi:hypothetical protein
MTSGEIEKRLKFLREQADRLKILEALTQIRDYYARKTTGNFDPGLSVILDCLDFLIQTIEGQDE